VVLAVESIVTRRAIGLGDQAGALIVSNGLDGDPEPTRQIPDLNSCCHGIPPALDPEVTIGCRMAVFLLAKRSKPTMNGVAVELATLLVMQTVGTAVFGKFEAETAVLRRLAKWVSLTAITLGLSSVIGHWALFFPVVIFAVGLVVHFSYCRKNGIDPFDATPRRRYYELRGWTWKE
jgi:hypothetical protein